MLLPAPVEPITATVWPGVGLEREVAQHRQVGAGVAELDGVQPRVPRSGTSVTGSSGCGTDVSVCRTSMTRSAQTAERGIIIIMKVPIITDITICIR